MCQELTIKVSLLEKRMQEKCIHLQGSEKNSNFWNQWQNDIIRYQNESDYILADISKSALTY